MKKSYWLALLSTLSILLGSVAFSQPKEAKADSITHQIIEEPITGLSVEETADGSSMVFSNPEVTNISKNKYLGIAINTTRNKSSFVDPYIFLQFSFMLGMEQHPLEFDATNPEIAAKLVKNSIYYPTTETGYTCPNRFFADSSTYFFLIKEGFSGTIYVQLSDYFSSDFNIDAFKIYSDGHNHWNCYELIELFLCDDTYANNKTTLVDLESLTYDVDYKINDASLDYKKQNVKKNTTLFKKIIKAHVTQSRLTMLNISNSSTSGTSELVVNLGKNYGIRDGLIININNILTTDLYFKVILVDDGNNEIALNTAVDKTHNYSTSDSASIDLACNGEYVILPASTINGTLLLSYLNFASKPSLAKQIKFQFKNNFECEIGKIIDAQDSLTGNYKTLVNPNILNDSELSITNPSSGTVINSSTAGVVFAKNNESIYHIVEEYNVTKGHVTHQINGDYVRFVISPAQGYIIDEVYVNDNLTNVIENEFTVPFTSDLHVLITFKEAKVYVTVDNHSNTMVYYETFGEDVIFHVMFQKGYTADYVNFNDERVLLNSDNTYVVSANLSKYEFEIATREITISINYLDNIENRHGECSYSIKNGKLYLIFKPDNKYALEYFNLNGKRIEFNGSIYSLNADKDVFVEVKFFKKNG